MSIHFGYKAEIGVFSAGYSENAFALDEEVEVTGSAIGVRIGGSVVYKITDRLFMEMSFGYLAASTYDSIEDISLKLGGLNGGIGLGIRF
ncbi:MAG: hypothetical protein GY940_37470 [bacterium]|nr:hypothetical protein [bacterium]